MDLKTFLKQQRWSVYKVNGAKRKFFGDTFYGPVWKKIPDNIDVDKNLMLSSLQEVMDFLGE